MRPAPSTLAPSRPNPACAIRSPRLTLRKSAFVFAPDSGTIILTGHLTAGQLAASLTLPGADKKPYPVTFAANLNATTISGTYITPRCRYAVSLHATTD